MLIIIYGYHIRNNLNKNFSVTTHRMQQIHDNRSLQGLAVQTLSWKGTFANHYQILIQTLINFTYQKQHRSTNQR